MWIRVLSTIFGKTMLSVVIVTTVFMGGLGIGALFLGKRADASKNPLRLFALFELLTGLSSLCILFLFFHMPSIYTSLYHASHLPQHYSQPVALLLSFLLLFVPTFFMGGTFPVIIRSLATTPATVKRETGIFYASNTIGGIVGAGMTGYCLIGTAGQINTQLFAIAINLIVGAIAFFLSRNAALNTAPDRQPVHAPMPGGSPAMNGILFLAGLTGFCGLGLEILTTKAFGVFLISSTYSFTSILVVFLSGIGLGGFVFAHAARKVKNLRLLCGVSQCVIGYYVIGTTAYLNDLPALLIPIKPKLFHLPVLYYTLPGLLLSLLHLLIPAFFMGVLFPLLCSLAATHVATVGSKIGRVYFANTIGSVCGPFVAALLLVPLLGVAKGLLFMAALLVLSGTFVFIRHARAMRHAPLFLFGAAALFVAGIPFLHRSVSRSVLHPPSLSRTEGRADTILYYKETVEGVVVVNGDRRTGNRTMYVNNNAVFGSTYDAVKVVKMLAHLPFLLGENIRDVLIVGFGTGVTAAEAARHDIQNITCVEICPGVREAARFFTDLNRGVLDDARLTFVGADGRSHLLLSNKRYDLISCDPTHPTLGSGNLYTREYFLLCKEHLTPAGVVSQYLPLHQITLREFVTIVKTFHSVFPHASVWLAHSHCILLAGPGEPRIDFSRMQRALTLLADPYLSDPYAVVASLLLDGAAIERFTRGAALSIDDKPLLDYHSLRGISDDNWHINAMELLKFRIDPQNHFYNIENRERVGRSVIGSELFLEALIRKGRGYRSSEDVKSVIECVKKAATVNPENEEISLFLDHELRMYNRILNK